MDDVNQFDLEDLMRLSLRSQYHASLGMLRQAVEACPDELWVIGEPVAFWRIVYHTAFCTHMYLQPNEAAFHRWEHHREDYQLLGPVPWRPDHLPQIGEPYSREQMLDYLAQCDAMVDAAVETLDLRSRDSGFWWYKMSKLEHQLVNIRHIQHHTGQLALRLRAAGTEQGLGWVGPSESATAGVR